MKAIKFQRNQSYLFLIATVVYLIYILATGQATLFYIVYIFWCEELIRYIFEVVFYKIFQKKIDNYHRFSYLKYSRFGFLIFHWLLTFALYGFAQIDKDAYNMDIIFLKNPHFNSFLILSIVKSFWFWREKYSKAKTSEIVEIDYSENGIWVLHISFILGIIILFILAEYEKSYLSTLETILVIIPFICLKSFIDIKNINGQYKRSITNFQAVEEIK